ncbi:MAG: glycosyltransferase [Saprospiraceae bacterium]|nr:glycosyltransferase [Saprospiraceae bacterium]
MQDNGKKILIITIGDIDHPSSRVRIIQHIPILKESGNFCFTWIKRIPKQPKSKFKKLFLFPIIKRLLSIKRYFLLKYSNWDLVFVQKVFISEKILKVLNKKNIPIIFDFDDSIFLNEYGEKNEDKTSQMIKYSSEIIVSTEELAEYCLNQGKKATLIYSSVDTRKYQPKSIEENKKAVTIGWVGSFTNTVHIEEIKPILQNISTNFKTKFILVGTRPDFSIENVDCKLLEWDIENEADILNEMDIGIMPLIDQPYSYGKGGYKLFLYMASGLPIVAAPYGINKRIVEHGKNGYLAYNSEDWLKYLSKLIVEPELRVKMGKEGRINVLKKYSLEVCSKQLLVTINNTLFKN